jgi:hypothetical protein
MLGNARGLATCHRVVCRKGAARTLMSTRTHPDLPLAPLPPRPPLCPASPSAPPPPFTRWYLSGVGSGSTLHALQDESGIDKLMEGLFTDEDAKE